MVIGWFWFLNSSCVNFHKLHFSKDLFIEIFKSWINLFVIYTYLFSPCINYSHVPFSIPYIVYWCLSLMPAKSLSIWCPLKEPSLALLVLSNISTFILLISFYLFIIFICSFYFDILITTYIFSSSLQFPKTWLLSIIFGYGFLI